MYYRGKHGDLGDGNDLGQKRQRMIDYGSSFYTTPPSASYVYNHPPYSQTPQPPPFPVVRLRGLPFDCTEADITDFLNGLDIIDILFVHKSGKFTGEVYCVLAYPLQVDYALQRNRQLIGRRYVEVFRSKRQEYYKAVAGEVSDPTGASARQSVPRAKSSDNAKDSAEHTGVLRLRGLPFSATKEAILDFFKNFELAESSIHITANSEGRATGEAFVEFASAEESKAAMEKDRKSLGNRYIELFPSSREELDVAVARGRLSATYKAKSDDGKELLEPLGVVRMRGLPFSAGKEDILDFFKEFGLTEESIHLTLNSDGRATGEAFVEFDNAEDSKAAMAKDRMTLGSRYIELFPSSHEELGEAVSKRW